ncbi:GNAT family N-acetyltransferase [Thermomonas brevis]
MTATIRRALPADADVLAALSARTFDETWGHLYTAQDQAEYKAHAYAPAFYRDALGERGYAAWLAEDADGAAVGYALAGPCALPHPQVQPGDMELKRIYLLKSAQNGGLGARLFDAVEAWLRANGPASIWIGVWSENFGAQRFYQRRGYEKAGEYVFEVGQARDREFILRKRP